MPDSTIVAPCQAACPALTDVQGYVSLAALGRFAEAFDVARLTNPIANCCGYICFHPCEEKCRRAAVDEAVSIMELKRACATFSEGARHEARGASRTDEKTLSESSQNRLMPHASRLTADKRIAVIGAGPAGLTAAQDLTKAGASVTVYEREDKAGGMLRQTIPAYRLPDEAIDRDVATAEATGFKIIYGRELGKNLALDEVRANHDAVIIAAGLPESRSLPVFPAEGDQIMMAIPFLRDVKAGKPPALKSHVIVVGGGNVAIDVARTALRLGAAEVNLVCLEAREEMPAHDWEIEEAAAEGVIMNCCLGPAEVLGGGAAPAGLKCQAVKSVFDADGIFNPTFLNDRFTDIAGDTIIVAIGQKHGGEIESALGPSPYEEGKDGLFFAGEFFTGPGSAIEAVKSGHDAAARVIAYLTDSEKAPQSASRAESREITEPAVLDELPERMRPLVVKKSRKRGAARPAADRKRDFGLFEPGLVQADTVREALRCMSCLSGAVVDKDTCVACLTCVRVCPFEIPKIRAENVAEIDTIECQACGLCVTECPASAIALTRGQEERLIQDIDGALAGTKEIEFFCMNRLENTDEPVTAAGRVPVPCAAQVSETVILTALLKGAKRVSVSICPESGCRYGSTEPGRDARRRLTDRVERVKQILTGLGLDPESINIREN